MPRVRKNRERKARPYLP